MLSISAGPVRLPKSQKTSEVFTEIECGFWEPTFWRTSLREDGMNSVLLLALDFMQPEHHGGE